ncbi:hypothetical protein BG005_002222, partial [Podila minutissima]
MGNKSSKQKPAAMPAAVPAVPAAKFDAIKSGYFTTDDQHQINLERYAALYHNYDDYDSNGTVLASKIKQEYKGKPHSSRL